MEEQEKITNGYKFMSVAENGYQLGYHDYSGSFDTRTQARQWYEKHGRWLIGKFNHKLHLFHRGIRVKVA